MPTWSSCWRSRKRYARIVSTRLLFSAFLLGPEHPVLWRLAVVMEVGLMAGAQTLPIFQPHSRSLRFGRGHFVQSQDQTLWLTRPRLVPSSFEYLYRRE